MGSRRSRQGSAIQVPTDQIHIALHFAPRASVFPFPVNAPIESIMSAEWSAIASGTAAGAHSGFLLMRQNHI
jgi:hypothetical protein